MREFGQSGIRKHERELLAANRDEIETLSTTLKLRGDCEGRDMAWHQQWLLLKAETRERRGAPVPVLTGHRPTVGIGQHQCASRILRVCSRVAVRPVAAANSAAGRFAGRGLNENLAREILELHTLGAEGG